MNRRLDVDVWSDAVCPWCWLGKRRFEQALAQRPELEVQVRWRPFQLNPGLPPAGEPRRAYLERRFGDPDRFRDAQRTLQELGRPLGIAFDFGRIERMPNTRAAHALVALAGERQGPLVEAVFRAYFEQGRDIGDPAVLGALATEVGLDGPALVARLGEPAAAAAVDAAQHEARALGISGVPCFVLAGRWAVSGAQEPAAFGRALDHVLAELGATPGGRPT